MATASSKWSPLLPGSPGGRSLTRFCRAGPGILPPAGPIPVMPSVSWVGRPNAIWSRCVGMVGAGRRIIRAVTVDGSATRAQSKFVLVYEGCEFLRCEVRCCGSSLHTGLSRCVGVTVYANAMWSRPGSAGFSTRTQFYGGRTRRRQRLLTTDILPTVRYER